MFERHFFVCNNRRGGETGLQSCGEQDGSEIFTALLSARQEKRMVTQIFITETKCLGPCPERGTTIAVYPENVWYTSVTLDDLAEIIEQHMVKGEPVERLRDPNWPG
jgi:(2Fe-2S) ferredoxin